MQCRFVVEARNCCREDIDQPENLVVRHDVVTAQFAVFAFDHGGFGKGGDIARAFGDRDGFGLSESEGIDRSTAPGTAGAAVAKAHAVWLATDFDSTASQKQAPL